MRGSNRTDWVVPESYGSTLPITFAATGVWIPVTILVGTGIGFLSELDPNRVHEFETSQRLTLLRVRGTITLSVVSAGPFRLHERVMVGMQDITDGSVAFPVDNTADVDAEDQFLWERISWIEEHASTPGHYPARTDHPFWSEIDVKSKRTVTRGECVVYCVAIDSPVSASMGLFHTMRSLVKR